MLIDVVLRTLFFTKGGEAQKKTYTSIMSDDEYDDECWIVMLPKKKEKQKIKTKKT